MPATSTISQSQKLSAGAVAGIAVGSIIAGILVILLGVYMIRRRLQQRALADSLDATAEQDTEVGSGRAGADSRTDHRHHDGGGNGGETSRDIVDLDQEREEGG